MASQRSAHRMNRIDPWGDLHAVSARGLLTGNRGCLVDDRGRMVSHHKNRAWISCQTSFGGNRHPLAAPRVWTPLFFLDDAVALAAGHRPCGRCRRADYRVYRSAVEQAAQPGHRVLAPEIDRNLSRERLAAGRGLSRRGDRKPWSADLDTLPTGTVVLQPDDGEHPHLLTERGLHRFTFQGWAPPIARLAARAQVLTPQTSVVALRNGFEPLLHPSSGVT